MQTLIKHRWAAVVSLAFTIIFGGLFFSTQTAFADGYGQIAKDCTYAFTSTEEKAIRRTDCPNGLKDLVYKDGDGTKRVYTQTSTKSQCTQSIELTSDDNDDSRTGLLAGSHEESNGDCENIDPAEDLSSPLGWQVTVLKSDAVPIGDTTSDEVGMAGRQSFVYGKLEKLVEKECKSDTSGYCDDIALKGIYSCTSEAWSKLEPNDKGKNSRFKDLLTNCIASKTDLKNKGDIRNALGDNIYTQTQAAGTRSIQLAANGGEASDEDTCNVSANPISWILCPIYDGLGSLSDSILNSVVRDFLHTNPVSTDPDNEVYQIWSSFRIWGNIFLVIALLVIVFGQAIGGGVVDAYTAKKVLPRLLVAAILINLSIYVVAFAVDVTNVIGRGVGSIINAPLEGVSLSPDGWKLGIFAAGAAGAATLAGFLAFAVGVGAVAGAIWGALPFLLLFVIIPVLLAIFFVFLILVFRQAVIIALVLVSPVAFALYCLPNTEQYFRKWWGLLVNMLMIYPIIMIIFAVANLLAYTSIAANGNDSFWGYLIAFLLQFLPLFLIPYAFKLAGGVLGRIHDIATGYGKRGLEAAKGDIRDPWSRRNRYKRHAGNKFLEARENMVEKGNTWQKRGGRPSGIAGRGVAMVGGLGNYEDLRSRRNKEASEMLQNHIATGGDSTVRALFTKKNASGVWEGTNGATYTDSEVAKARNLYGRDPSMFQAAYTYELGKAANDTELETTMYRANEKMQELRLPGADAITIGAHYSHQQTRRELKHTKRKEKVRGARSTGEISYERGAQAFTQEVAENVSNWSLGNMRTSTVKALQTDYKEAGAALAMVSPGSPLPQGVQQSDVAALQAKIRDNENYLFDRGLAIKPREDEQLSAKHLGKSADVRRFVTSTANSLDSRFQSRGSYALAGEDASQPVSGSQSGAPGLVSEEIGKLVDLAAPPRPQQQPPQRPPEGDYRDGGQMDGRGYL